MRSRNELEKAANIDTFKRREIDSNHLSLIFEIVLDIRDLLVENDNNPLHAEQKSGEHSE